jgi:cytochrome c-type biogenesis protein CcmE
MNPKIGAVVALLIAGGGLAFLALGDLGENLVYYWSPTEMMAQKEKAIGATIRLGGMVAPGSLDPSGTTLKFKVTDGGSTVPVESSGVPPQMFREGIGVVVEGTLASDGTFKCTRMMVKHDNEYRAPHDGEKPSLDTLDEG